MAVNNFIPSIWSARILATLHKNLVYCQPTVVNRDYEGEIKGMGDSVRINSIGAINVGKYQKNTDISAPQELSDAQTMLLIDQSDYFNFQIDDVDKAQQNPKVMDQAMTEAGYALGDSADQYVAGFYSQAATANNIGTDASPQLLASASDAYDILVALGVKLTNAKVPKQNRYVVVPPWFTGLLLKDNRFVAYGTDANVANLASGEILRPVAGFRVLESINVPNTADAKYKITAGHPMAISFADQITETEAYRPEKRFADAVKGLHVYGGKVIRPTALACLTANHA